MKRRVVEETVCSADDRGRFSAADGLAFLGAAAMLALLLGTGCELIVDKPSSDAACSVTDAGTTDTDEGGEFDTDVSCVANDSEATGSIQGPILRAETVANGSDSDATTTVAQTICYEVGADGSLAVNMTITEQRFEKFCPGRNGHSRVETKLTIRREGYAPLVIYDAAASIGCDHGDVTNEGFPPCTETIADIRFLCEGSDFIQDVLQLDAGDSFAADLDLSAESQLPIDAVDGDVSEARVGATYSLSAGFLTIVPCTSATSCVTNGDCSGQDELCLDENCRVPTFGANLGPVFTINPDPVSSGQLFSMRVSLSATEGELIPVSIVASVPDTAMDASGPLAAGQVGGACLFDSTQRFLIATGTPNEFYLDTNQSFTFEQGEPTVAYGASGSGEFVFDIDIPPSGIRTTVAADATVVCSFNTLFIAGTEGTYPIQVDATSVDFATGVDPLTYSSSDQDLVIGEGGSSPSCGQPVSSNFGSLVSQIQANTVTATDALFILRVAVGLGICELCVCDVDDNGANTATDALAVLRSSVGLPVTLTCPAC